MPQNHTDNDDRSWLSAPFLLLVSGVLLILASFLPVGDYFAKSQWTREDSAAYDRINTEYKRSTYEPRAKIGLTEEQWKGQREKMRRHMAAMERKLQNARQQPERWSRYLLWIGVSLAIIGGLLHANAAHEN